jgi:hypothetical protein
MPAEPHRFIKLAVLPLESVINVISDDDDDDDEVLPVRAPPAAQQRASQEEVDLTHDEPGELLHQDVRFKTPDVA